MAHEALITVSLHDLFPIWQRQKMMLRTQTTGEMARDDRFLLANLLVLTQQPAEYHPFENFDAEQYANAGFEAYCLFRRARKSMGAAFLQVHQSALTKHKQNLEGVSGQGGLEPVIEYITTEVESVSPGLIDMVIPQIENLSSTERASRIFGIGDVILPIAITIDEQSE